MTPPEETYGFHLYGTLDPATRCVIQHFPAIQVTEENLRRLSYVTEGGVIDDRLCWSGPRFDVQTARIGDWVTSDMSGGYKSVEQETFMSSYVKVV